MNIFVRNVNKAFNLSYTVITKYILISPTVHANSTITDCTRPVFPTMVTYYSITAHIACHSIYHVVHFVAFCAYYMIIYLIVDEINQSATTRVAIPPSGNLNIQTPAGGYGSILVETAEGIKWVVDLNPTLSRQSFKLQPGQYQVVFRSKKSQQTSYSRAQRFSISSGKTTILRLN